MPEASRSDDQRARDVLPTLEDLGAPDWHLDDVTEGGPAAPEGPGALLPDACLPDDFPDGAVVAGAEVGFVHPESAGLYAMSAVFGDLGSADRGWNALRTDEFARCFAASVAADVELPADVHLLGPVMQPLTLDVDTSDGAGVTVATGQATFASATNDDILPVVLRLGVVRGGRALVTVWCADEDDAAADAAWQRVMARVARRCGAP